MFLGLRSPLPDAVKNTVDRHVRAIALEAPEGVARFVRARAAIESDAIDATSSTQVLPKPGACAGNFTFAGREDDGDVKLHASTVAESITNWPEVVDKLRGTRFEKYLTMDGSVLP